MVTDIKAKCVGLIHQKKQDDNDPEIDLDLSLHTPKLSLMEFLSTQPDRLNTSQFVEVPIFPKILLI